MKYLVISRAEDRRLVNFSREVLARIRAGLVEAMGSGRVEAAYGIRGGGSVWVINADSEAELHRVLDRVGVHDVDVTEVVPALDLVDEHIRRQGDKRHKTALSHPSP